MKRIVFGLLLAFIMLLSVSCDYSIKGVSDPGTADEIVLPESSGNSKLNVNLRNVVPNNAYQQNVVNKLYDNIGTEQFCVDFCVDEKNIYVLRYGEKADGVETGKLVDVYDVETGRLITKISAGEDIKCNAIAINNKMIYLYDYVSGEILKYSTEGTFVGKTDTKMPNVKVAKMEVLDWGARLAVLGAYSGKDMIYILSCDSHKYGKLSTSNVTVQLDYDGSIQDFCIMNESSIVIKVSPERICLYDLNKERVVKTSYIPDSAKLIQFSSGILYSVSVPKVALYGNQVANISNEGSGNSIGRLIVGVDFPWSTDSASLNDFQLGDISIPFAGIGLNHIKMKQNNKYLFFLDRGNNGKAEASSIYRVAK